MNLGWLQPLLFLPSKLSYKDNEMTKFHYDFLIVKIKKTKILTILELQILSHNKIQECHTYLK